MNSFFPIETYETSFVHEGMIYFKFNAHGFHEEGGNTPHSNVTQPKVMIDEVSEIKFDLSQSVISLHPSLLLYCRSILMLSADTRT